MGNAISVIDPIESGDELIIGYTSGDEVQARVKGIGNDGKSGGFSNWSIIRIEWGVPGIPSTPELSFAAIIAFFILLFSLPLAKRKGNHD